MSKLKTINEIKQLLNEAYYEHASFQAEVPEDIKRLVRNLAATIDPEDLAENGIEDYPHITLAYPIDILKITNLEFIPKTPIEFIIDSRVTYFDTDDAKVAKINVFSKELHDLHDKLVEEYEVEETYSHYQPHITIAYLKKDSKDYDFDILEQESDRDYETTGITLMQNGTVLSIGNVLTLKHADDPDSDFDSEQLKAGIKVEMEHTEDPEVAKAICKAHLSEFPDYYVELSKMEDKLKSKKECIQAIKKLLKEDTTQDMYKAKEIGDTFDSWFNSNKVFYHGTNEKFDIFDTLKTKIGWLGRGIYFTPNKSYAKKNGKIIKEVLLYTQTPYIIKGDSPSDVISELKKEYPDIDDSSIEITLKENGYDSIYFTHWDIGLIVNVFSISKIKTYEQLKNEWDKIENYSDIKEDAQLGLFSAEDNKEVKATHKPRPYRVQQNPENNTLKAWQQYIQKVLARYNIGASEDNLDVNYIQDNIPSIIELSKVLAGKSPFSYLTNNKQIVRDFIDVLPEETVKTHPYIKNLKDYFIEEF